MRPRSPAGIALVALVASAAFGQTDDPTPPKDVVRLVFIHHSTGENWLSDENGGLARALQANHYFVSDTNYGWGPDGIGDRTDIVDWPEWFVGEGRDSVLSALYEEGETHSPYERTLDDPGGENEIVLFKSCFPNSDLEGRPGDAPGEDCELSVGGAKRVYLDILEYFGSRPDKLFVVITAPPLSDSTHAANARAFNLWLANDWLESANYEGANVAVWDFYNVLTSPENHHRVRDGRLEHVVAKRKDTLHYPSEPGDDHPSQAGNRKATEEFVPALNAFVNRWRAAHPVERIPPRNGKEGSAAPAGSTAIDGFEGEAPEGTEGWQAFDEREGASLRIEADDEVACEGDRSLRLEANVPKGSWATCTLYYEGPADRSKTAGLRFRMRANRAGFPFSVHIYSGGREDHACYHAELETPEEAVDGWAEISLPWDRFRRVEWEEDAGSPCPRDRVVGVGIGLGAPEDDRLRGTLWLDEVAWIEGR